ncbi:MAG: hypothetical protein JW765_05870 [Deltaproteobacteria bacterium]|nr:hypothetical protein [Candidatus Zymogenaceae bacterium]
MRYVLGFLFFCLGAGLLLMSFLICQSDERFFAGVFFCIIGLIIIALGILVIPKKKRGP